MSLCKTEVMGSELPLEDMEVMVTFLGCKVVQVKVTFLTYKEVIVTYDLLLQEVTLIHLFPMGLGIFDLLICDQMAREIF